MWNFSFLVGTVVFGKLVSHLLQSPGKRGEASLLILRASVCICDTNAGVDPGFVNIQSTAVLTKDFEHGVPPARKLQRRQGLAVRRSRVNFGRDKFTGYGFAPFIDAFTDSRHHIKMRGLLLSSPATPLLGFCSVPTLHNEYSNLLQLAKGLLGFISPFVPFAERWIYKNEHLYV